MAKIVTSRIQLFASASSSRFFVDDVLRTLWRLCVTDVEIFRPEFDAHGYDVVMSRGAVVRHVELKTQAAGKASVGRALAEKPSGCVVWIGLNKDTLELEWLGDGRTFTS